MSININNSSTEYYPILSLSEILGNNSPPISIDACDSIHKQWENEALKHLWEAISKQIGQPPSPTSVQDIEAWFEDPANDEILKNIKEINMSNSTLQALPLQLLKCSQLKNLYLSHNQITTLPEWFGNLSQLQNLYLDNTKITSLPESFRNLSQLKYLSLENNHISLPEWFGNFSQSQIHVDNLSLHKNLESKSNAEILGNNSPPISIDACDSIHKQWENEALKHLWEAISKQIDQPPRPTSVQDIEAWFEDPANDEILKNIKEINMSNSTLQALPPQLLKCSQLKNLYLSHNQITTLPEWFGNLSQLQNLYLDNTQITSLPESFRNLSQLKYLSLENNHISLPEWFGNFSQLQIHVGNLSPHKNLDSESNSEDTNEK